MIVTESADKSKSYLISKSILAASIDETISNFFLSKSLSHSNFLLTFYTTYNISDTGALL